MGWNQWYISIWTWSQNPEGIRVGGEGGQKSAVKVWEQRQYSNLDDSIIIGIRDIKMALEDFANLPVKVMIWS